MKRRIATLLGSIVLASAGCIMVNSSTTMDTQAKIQYRTTENATHGDSNTVSNAAAWEGGGKVDAQIPMGVTP